MQLEISVVAIAFLYIAFVMAGVAFTGIGVERRIDNDDYWKPHLILGVSLLVVAVVALIVGITSNFIQITIKD